jgi:hypothetical protein
LGEFIIGGPTVVLKYEEICESLGLLVSIATTTMKRTEERVQTLDTLEASDHTHAWLISLTDYVFACVVVSC